MFSAQVEQVRYTADSLVVGLPVMTETYEEALAQMEELPYKTYGIAAASAQGKGPAAQPTAYAASTTTYATTPYATTAHATTPHATTTYAAPTSTAYAHATTPYAPATAYASNKAIFKVKADLAADNYQLYTAEDLLYETAMVPTYKCSVMLNSLFRKIKENGNLDLLEESDDEEEFENTKIDKFVDLEKTVLMECVYSKRFKKWQPVKTVIGNQHKVISSKDLHHFFKR